MKKPTKPEEVTTPANQPTLPILCAQCFPTPLARAKERGGCRLSMDPRVSGAISSAAWGQQTLLWKQSPQQQVTRGPKKEQSFRTAAMGWPSLRTAATQRPPSLGKSPMERPVTRWLHSTSLVEKALGSMPPGCGSLKGVWICSIRSSCRNELQRPAQRRKENWRFSRNGVGMKGPEGTAESPAGEGVHPP